MPVSLDPVGAVGRRSWQRQIQDRDALSGSGAGADRHDLIIDGQVERRDGNRHPQNRSLER